MEISDHHSLRWLAYEIEVPGDLLLAIAADPEKHYRPFEKKCGDKRRLIDNPDEMLKSVHTQIRDRLLVPIPLSPIVHGCVRGRSPFTNALQHVGQSSLASLDVKKCYPSITNAMVFRFFRERLRLGPMLAGILTKLTTRRGHLPHGAPTSDALANLILSPVDADVERIGRDFDLEPTRYVDNIDYSGRRSREALGPTIEALRRHGLAVAHKKTFNRGLECPTS